MKGVTLRSPRSVHLFDTGPWSGMGVGLHFETINYKRKVTYFDRFNKFLIRNTTTEEFFLSHALINSRINCDN